MDKKERVAKLLDEFSEEYKDEYLKDLANQIDQIYNQPDPELREKIADIIRIETKGNYPESPEAIADEILSLLNPKEPVTEPCPDNSLVQCNSYDIDCKRCIHCKPHKETADCKDYVRCETTGLEVRCETCNGTGSK